MSRRNQKGQALILVVVALGLFLIGAMGLVIDGAQIYTNHVMAQVAADAAAQAGVMSMFTGTSVTGANPFGTGTSPGAYTCTTTDAITPCVYARMNGFGQTAADSVVVSYPTSLPGVALSASPDPANTANVIQVTITRTLTTGLMQLLGSSTSTAKAIGVAAIVDKVSPIPIIVLHPNLPGAFSINGGAGTGNFPIKICGGPDRSIQVNSSDPASISVSGGSTVDLSHAGPADPGNCTTGTGANFGDFGGPAAYPGGLSLGTTGRYLQPAGIINDPLLTVPQPAVPTVTGSTIPITPASATRYGCPALQSCDVYLPGKYTSGISVSGSTIGVFAPGLYYITSGGFSMGSNSRAMMASSGFTADPVTGSGMVVFNSGNNNDDVINFSSNAGANSPNITLVGSDPCPPAPAPCTSVYKGILFFQDRTVTIKHDGTGSFKAHSIQGGGAISLTGTIYVVNNNKITYPQQLALQGNAGSNTTIVGQMIVDTVSVGGTANVTMNLNPNSVLHIRQVALVR